MKQTVIIKYNRSIERLPKDSCISINLLNMTNITNTMKKIDRSKCLIESYTDGVYTKAFNLEYVELFKTTLEMNTNPRFKLVNTSMKQGSKWYTYCVIFKTKNIKEDLLQGKIIKVKKYMISELLDDMDDINTLNIQKCIDGDYWIKVDNATINKYIQERYGE